MDNANTDSPNARIPLGARATIRYRLADGSAADVVGLVVGLDRTAATVQDRAGAQHVVALADVIIAKPLAPVGRGRDPRRAAPAELEYAAAASWHDRQEPLGDWLLRAAASVTFRANSTLALGDPGRAVPDAAAAVVAYAEQHHISPVAQVVAESDEEAALRDLGWRPFRDDVAVLACRTIDLCASGPGTATVSPRLDPDWAAQYLADHPTPAAEATRRLLTCGAPAFARIDRAGAPAAMGRGSQVGDWAVVTALWTRVEHRRRGLMREIVRSLAWWAGRRGARSLMLQVAERNTGALAAYQRIGLVRHHRYRYLRPGH